MQHRILKDKDGRIPSIRWSYLDGSKQLINVILDAESRNEV